MRIPCWHRTTSLPTRSKVMNLILMTNNKETESQWNILFSARPPGKVFWERRRLGQGPRDVVHCCSTLDGWASEVNQGCCDGNYSNSLLWQTNTTGMRPGWMACLTSSTCCRRRYAEERYYRWVYLCVHIYASGSHILCKLFADNNEMNLRLPSYAGG